MFWCLIIQDIYRLDDILFPDSLDIISIRKILPLGNFEYLLKSY